MSGRCSNKKCELRGTDARRRGARQGINYLDALSLTVTPNPTWQKHIFKNKKLGSPQLERLCPVLIGTISMLLGRYWGLYEKRK